MSIIKLKNVSKFYYSKGVIASGFTKLNLEFNMGEFVAITGESGSGKSTLLNVISGLDTYEEGELYINGEETSHYTDKDFEDYRRKYIGNIFQNFNLVNSYTVFQNIELVLLLNGAKRKDIKEKVLDLIKTVDLYKFRNTKVSKLSGGQKQRVAIARALAKDTPIIIADEPTGNLDSRSATGIIKLLSEIAKDKLVVIVTHNYEQVEPYVTRKIKMHDGKVLEDKKIKEYEKVVDQEEKVYKNITFFNKIRLGLRNTFNIVPKFLLVLAVYLFITVALVGEYTSFKQDEYNEMISGTNSFFNRTDDSRIIIKKNDGAVFTEEDYLALKKMKNVDKIYENDLLLDREVSFTTNNYDLWLNGNVYSREEITKVDKGELPKEDNEIVIAGAKDDYQLTDELEKILNSTYFLESRNTGTIDNTKPLKITGVIYSDEMPRYTYYFYVPDSILNTLQKDINKEFSSLQLTFLNKIYKIDDWNSSLNIKPNSRVSRGQAFIEETYKYNCPKENCYNSLLTYEVTNLYYKDSLTVRPTNYYNSDNFNKVTGLPKDDYYAYSGYVFINPDDYTSLYDKENYQSSIFVKDVKKLEETEKALQDMGYTTFTMRKTKITPEALKALQILKTSVTIFLVVVLFFICYFVIKLILKSRNVYFATIRMLGATKAISRELLIIELLTVSNLAYLILLGFIYLCKIHIVKVDMLTNMLKYLETGDYIILYILLVGISFMVSIKFAKSLFKKSAMSSIREEV